MIAVSIRRLLALVLLLAGTAASAEPKNGEFEAFFDGLVPYALSQAGIAGGVVSVVKDGQLVFAKGYGLADVAADRPVDAGTTLFRTGSTSKLVTWTAVMQMVEQGKIDLDADVNRYLEFKIPETFAQPVTMRHLLTHTSGFEEMRRGIAVASAAEMPPLGAFLAANIPQRIFAPGARVAYSNYGASLAGHIVERVSGLDFVAYTTARIFEPLGMRHSSFAQPAVPEAALSKAYSALSRPRPEPFWYIPILPAGAMHSTAPDMARFMLAYLQGGTLDGVQILKPETVALMHRLQYQIAPGRNGMAFGFLEEHRNGHRMLTHPGDVSGFHTNLHLMPDARYGLFVSLNSTGEFGRQRGSDVVRTGIFHAFVDRFLPGPVPDEATLPTAQAAANEVAGYYISTRRTESARRYLAIFQPDIQISANDDGTIQVSTRLAPSGVPKHWRQVGPLVWREVGGQAHLSFVKDQTGRIVQWISDDYPPALAFEPLRGVRGTGLLAPLLYLSVLACAAAAIVAAAGRFRRRRDVAPVSRWWGRARLALGAQVLVLLLWFLGIVLGLDDPDAGVPLLLPALRLLTVLAVAAVVPVAVHALQTLRAADAGVRRRLLEIALLAASLYIAWFALGYGLVLS